MQHNVLISKHSFCPNKIEINVNDSIVFKNNDNVNHSIVSDLFDSKEISEYQSFEYTFKRDDECQCYLDFNPNISLKVTVKNSNIKTQHAKTMKEKSWYAPKLENEKP